MKTKTVRQTATFSATPHQMYETLMDSRKHSKFSGAPATISRKVGGKISAYGGFIEGKNLELVPDKKIVQAWRGSDWPSAHYSRVTFTFKRVKGGTRLSFTQSGVPENVHEHIKKGWIEHYWQPIKGLFTK